MTDSPTHRSTRPPEPSGEDFDRPDRDGDGPDGDARYLDSARDRRVRDETPVEQLDRNLAGLLQELRVVQTGVQLLTGFLLTLPFQSRFADVPGPMRVVYLVVVAASIAATVFLTAPVAAHRILFRRHRLEQVVAAAHRWALIGLLLLGVALSGVAVLIFDIVAGPGMAIAAGAASAVLFAAVWGAYPWWLRTHDRR